MSFYLFFQTNFHKAPECMAYEKKKKGNDLEHRITSLCPFDLFWAISLPVFTKNKRSFSHNNLVVTTLITIISAIFIF